MGDRPRTSRNRASSRERDTATSDASSATVHRRPGALCIDASAGEHGVTEGGDPAVVDGRRRGQMDAQHLHQDELGEAGGDRVPARFGPARLGQGVLDAGSHPAARLVRRGPDHEDRRERPHPRVEQRVLGEEVAAHQVGRRPATAVAQAGHHGPGRGVDEGGDRHGFDRIVPRDRVPVAVGQDDHVALRPRDDAPRRPPPPSTSRVRRCGR